MTEKINDNGPLFLSLLVMAQKREKNLDFISPDPMKEALIKYLEKIFSDPELLSKGKWKDDDLEKLVDFNEIDKENKLFSGRAHSVISSIEYWGNGLSQDFVNTVAGLDECPEQIKQDIKIAYQKIIDGFDLKPACEAMKLLLPIAPLDNPLARIPWTIAPSKITTQTINSFCNIGIK
jgi:hypothetical protein